MLPRSHISCHYAASARAPLSMRAAPLGLQPVLPRALVTFDGHVPSNVACQLHHSLARACPHGHPSTATPELPPCTAETCSPRCCNPMHGQLEPNLRCIHAKCATHAFWAQGAQPVTAIHQALLEWRPRPNRSARTLCSSQAPMQTDPRHNTHACDSRQPFLLPHL